MWSQTRVVSRATVAMCSEVTVVSQQWPLILLLRQCVPTKTPGYASWVFARKMRHTDTRLGSKLFFAQARAWRTVTAMIIMTATHSWWLFRFSSNACCIHFASHL
jgi:hypothetical protein